MRAFLLSLLLANALFLAWATWIDTPTPAPTMAGASLPELQVLPVPAAQPEGVQAAGASPSHAAPAAAAAIADTPPASAAAVTTRCSSFGPLADAEASRGVQVALVARKLTGRERTVVGEELEGYWVHIDHLGEESARLRVIHKLQVAGIHGAVALADTGQVSVGLFSEQEPAAARAAAVGKVGFKAEVGPRNHAVTRYWLDVEAPAGVPLPSVDALMGAASDGAAPSWQPCAGTAGAAGAVVGSAPAASAVAPASPAASGSTAPPPPATAR